MGRIENFARFYTLLKKMQGADKETLVMQFTMRRTSSLKEMDAVEYLNMCNAMERELGAESGREAYKQQVKKQRSVCLHLMQRLGIDTTDWMRVDNFTYNKRICGKKFNRLSMKELESLEKKCRAIERNGGLKPHVRQGMSDEERVAGIYIIPTFTIGEA